MPFTQAQFFAVFVTYNNAIWPAQWLAYALGIVLTVVAWRGREGAARTVATALGILWAWTGVAYHWLHFASINPAAYIFGAAFVLQAALLLVVALRPFAWRRARGVRRAAGLAAILYALLVYPLLGLVLGHGWPAMPAFGVAPCPLTLFTLGLLLLAANAPLWLFAIPLLWSVIGGLAAWLLGVPEDLGLWVVGALTAALLLLSRRRLRQG